MNSCLLRVCSSSQAAASCGRLPALFANVLHCQTCQLPRSGAAALAAVASQVPARSVHVGPSLSRPAAASAPVTSDPTRRAAARRPGPPDLLYSRVQLELRAHDTAVLDSYTQFLLTAAKHLDVNVGEVRDLERVMERRSLLKSVHVFGKHKVQYEVRTMLRVLELRRLTGSTVDTFLEYVQRMLPEAIAMKVTRFAREPLPDHLITPAAMPPVEPVLDPPATDADAAADWSEAAPAANAGP